MKITAISPWFGSKRTLAPTIVHQLGRHSYFLDCPCGSLSVLLAKDPSEHETAVDLHGALTNLAWVVQSEDLAAQLFNRLQRVMYSDAVYRLSKSWLERFEGHYQGDEFPPDPDLDWAYHYFIASWMGRNGVAGTERVNYQLAVRWTKGGGSGPLRFRNAVDSIPAWCERLRNILILRKDCFEVLGKVQDDTGVAIYSDPPYLPGTVAGNSKYLHDFTAADHRRLAELLCRFKKARVVVSYYDDPELDRLYPGWTKIDCSRHKHLHVQNKRGSKRKEAPEILLVNGPAYPEESKGNGHLFEE